MSLDEMAESRVRYDDEKDLYITDVGRYFWRYQAIWAEKRWLSREVGE